MSSTAALSGIKILIAEDVEENRFVLREALAAQGAEVFEYVNGAELLRALDSHQPDLIISDVSMPEMTGIELAKKVKSDPVHRFIPFLLLTAQTELKDLTAGFEAGADDYLKKPFKGEELIARVKAALRTRKTYLELKEVYRLNRELSGRLSADAGYCGMVGTSEAIRSIYDLISKVADSDVPVLITGESGTGKELAARAVHAASGRKNRPFVVQNCAAFNDQLLESELFGHVRGAFTGAARDKPGLFDTADGGTFFLDEIGEMSPTLQAKLLRVLQDGTFMPVGSVQARKVNVRIIAATHRDLPKLIKEDKFREDLWYRLNVINVAMPALRERRGDIAALADNFLSEIAQRTQKDKKSLANAALSTLAAYDWPGNIRQLRNEIERAFLLSGDGAVIGAEHFSPQIQKIESNSSAFEGGEGGTLKDILARVERNVIENCMKRHEGNKSEVARELDMSRTSLIAKVKEYGGD